FQIGQLYNSPRDAETGVDQYDLFTTVQTTRGFVSNGVSESMLVNGEAGNDKFVVFRNLAVLTLKGGTGDDEFIVKAFALEGSVDDPGRDRTVISGQEGADRIEYAINAPVDIDGGDGFDTVKVIGTEFGDDFVVTDDGIYGGGLNINFINVEKVTLDAAEGNDRIYIRSTDDGHITEILAGEGSDTFSIGGDSPPVTSRDLLGHSGIVTHSSSSDDSRFDGMIIDGISANVADDDEAGIVVSALDLVRTWEDGVLGQYGIVLTKEPEEDVIISLIQQQPTPNETADDIQYYHLVDNNGDAISSLTFTADNWDQQQTVFIQAFDDSAVEGLHYAVINHKVVSDDSGYDRLAIPTVTVEIVDNDYLELLISETGGATQVVEGGAFGDSFPLVDSYLVQLTAPPQGGETVTVTLNDPTGQLSFDRTELVFSAADYDVPQEVLVAAGADGLLEGMHTSYIYHSMQVGGEAAVDGPVVRVDIGDSDVPGVMIVQTGGSTNVIENNLDKIDAPFVDSYELVLTARPDSDVTVTVTPEETKTSAQIFDPTTGKYVTVDRFAEQVTVEPQQLVFTPDNWYIPQTVGVTALDDAVIDGGDTKVFAPISNTIAGIQGPLFIDGAGGEGSGAGLGGDPFMLPGENNDVGDVVAATADTLVAAAENVDKLGDTYFKDLSLVKVVISSGTGAGQVRYLLDQTLDADQENYRFVTAEAWEITPDASSRYYFERELPQTDESQQVDVATVYNQDSPADNFGARSGVLSADNLSGLGMGPDLQIGETTFSGGISYVNLENLTINLGSGIDELEVTGIQNREGFQTVTVVNTGAGDDWVHFNGAQAGESGLFALHLEQGDDRVTAENTTADLIIFGDDGTDRIQSGDGNDIVFADFGRIDYLNDAGEVVTRFGLGQSGIVRDAVIPGTDLQSVPFAQTDGAFYGSIAVSRLVDTGWNDELHGGGGNDLLIGGAGDDEVHGDAGDDILIGDNGVATFDAGQLLEVSSGDPNIGGSDELYGGTGSDLLIGGAEVDRLYGDSGNDYLVGDAGRGTYIAGALHTVETLDRDRFIGGDDWLDGGAGNDAMFGGHGHDTFVGNFSEDLMIGEYGRLTIEGGRVETVVRLGQGKLDLIANRQFGLYSSLALKISLAQLGNVRQLTQLREFNEAKRPEPVLEKRLTHHGADFSIAAKDLGYGYHPEGEAEELPAQDVQDEQLVEPQPLETEVPEDKAQGEPDGEKGESLDVIPEEGESAGQFESLESQPEESGQLLKAAVAGFAGWGLGASRRQKSSSVSPLDFTKMQTRAKSWRWENGRLRKPGWGEDLSEAAERSLTADFPTKKTGIKHQKRV
ncbi:MAG: hypothetical protein JXK94_15785, partial [Deltaproteobacteria bacterium]|nr:hypothetical protein [Deltaproteobacteria bacterium]